MAAKPWAIGRIQYDKNHQIIVEHQFTGCPFLVQDMITAESGGVVAAQYRVSFDPSARVVAATSNVSPV